LDEVNSLASPIVKIISDPLPMRAKCPNDGKLRCSVRLLRGRPMTIEPYLRGGRLLASLACLAACLSPVHAMVGGAATADKSLAQHIALIVGSRGTSCTGVVIARTLVLTAAHCALPGAAYKIVEFDSARQPVLRDIVTTISHPQFELGTLLNHRATADVALLKLAAPLSKDFVAVPLADRRKPVAVGDHFLVAGYGVAVRGDGRSGGTVRVADLVTTGEPGTLQIRLVDSDTNGTRPGLSACTGDSGAPVFDTSNGTLAVIGLVSWSTGPLLTEGCGGLTGVTPLQRYRGWIVETAGKIGALLP
jgi:hypothetical protein